MKMFDKGFYISILIGASIWLGYAFSLIGFHWANIILFVVIILGAVLLENAD